MIAMYAATPEIKRSSIMDFNLRTTQTFYTTSPTQRGKYLPQK